MTTNNTAKTDLIAKIAAFADQSEGAWMDCVDNARGPARRRQAARAEVEAADFWLDAQQAIEAGDTKAAREALEQAAELAAKWGYAGPEKAALAAFDAAVDVQIRDIKVALADFGLLTVTATVETFGFAGGVRFSALPADPEGTRRGISPAGDDVSGWMDDALYTALKHERAVEVGLEVLARADRVGVLRAA